MSAEKFDFELSELCVIAILSSGDSYGYEINQELLSVLEMSESSLYPILKKFERQGVVEGYSREQGGRLRRYYRLTTDGFQLLDRAKTEWAALREWLDKKLINGGEKSE